MRERETSYHATHQECGKAGHSRDELDEDQDSDTGSESSQTWRRGRRHREAPWVWSAVAPVWVDELPVDCHMSCPRHLPNLRKQRDLARTRSKSPPPVPPPPETEGPLCLAELPAHWSSLLYWRDEVAGAHQTQWMKRCQAATSTKPRRQSRGASSDASREERQASTPVATSSQPKASHRPELLWKVGPPPGNWQPLVWGPPADFPQPPVAPHATQQRSWLVERRQSVIDSLRQSPADPPKPSTSKVALYLSTLPDSNNLQPPIPWVSPKRSIAPTPKVPSQSTRPPEPLPHNTRDADVLARPATAAAKCPTSQASSASSSLPSREPRVARNGKALPPFPDGFLEAVMSGAVLPPAPIVPKPGLPQRGDPPNPASPGAAGLAIVPVPKVKAGAGAPSALQLSLVPVPGRNSHPADEAAGDFALRCLAEDQQRTYTCTGGCGKVWKCWDDVPSWSKGNGRGGRKPWCNDCGWDKPGPWNNWLGRSPP